MQRVTLKNGDNFRFVASNSVDMVLTDPPFNISKKSNFHTYAGNTIHSYQFDENADESWDSYTHQEFLGKLDEWSSEWSRVLRKGGTFAVFCADAYLSHLFEALKNNGLVPRRVIVWRKNNAVPVNRAYIPMSACEYVVVGVKKGVSTFNANVPIVEQGVDEKVIESTIVADKVSSIVYAKIKDAVLKDENVDVTDNDHIKRITDIVSQQLSSEKTIKDVNARVTQMYKTDSNGEKYLQACVPNYVQNPIKVGNRLHPTEKPVPLLQYLIALYSKPGDLILDSFGGSGSTGEAAVTMGRDTILIERDPSFYEKIKNRLENLVNVDMYVS